MLENLGNYIKNLDYNYIEMLVLLFFTYSFCGWVMESIGGIFKVKKFVNRGFLIGPLCPVYGVGVVSITLLLNKYTNDIIALFVLATVICGILEYLTSYIMEKLFNARWWDYKNKKFNINGRICLENLCLFGIAGTTILCIINPFFISIYMKIPDITRHIITFSLIGLFVIDFIISFIIIYSFKGATYEKIDNTEEITEKVKDKAEDIIMQAESDAIVSIRKITVKGLKLQRKIRYTRNQLFGTNSVTLRDILDSMNENREEFIQKINNEKIKVNEQIKLRKTNLENKQKESKEIIENKIHKTKEEFEEIQRVSKEKIENTIKNIKETSEEFSKQVKERFSSQSWLKRRLMEAFPEMKVNNTKKDKKIKNK